MIRLTRRYRFASSHRLHSPELSPERNREAFGKCNNPFGHGHNYVLEVSVAGRLDQSGRVVDLVELDRLVEERVLRAFHHRNLNTDVEEFSSLVPTSENLAVVIGRRLAAAWPGPAGNFPVLEKLRLFETRRNIIEHTELAESI